MTDEHDPPEEPQALAEEEARRLLARASEIDSARWAELPLAELREAAREAGIAPDAFDKALGELRDSRPVADSESVAVAPAVGSRFRAVLLRSAGTVALVIATLLALMLMVDWFFP